jgi:hypothetical protein
MALYMQYKNLPAQNLALADTQAPFVGDLRVRVDFFAELKQAIQRRRRVRTRRAASNRSGKPGRIIDKTHGWNN